MRSEFVTFTDRGKKVAFNRCLITNFEPVTQFEASPDTRTLLHCVGSDHTFHLDQDFETVLHILNDMGEPD